MTNPQIATSLSSRYASNGDVELHYRTAGSGPLIVLVHGFPDFWFTWRHQLDRLAATHTVAALDTRGYNRSDAPTGVAAYAMHHLVDDVAAVIQAEGRSSATIIGHDWGGSIAWTFGATRPAMTDGLVIINMPHPHRIGSALRAGDNPQADAMQYATDFRREGSEDGLDAHALAAFVARDDAERSMYVAAFERSDFAAMMNYYRANSRTDDPWFDAGALIAADVLQIHGLQDPTLLASSLNDTWASVAGTLELVTIPGAGHNAHHDTPERVTHTIERWLARPTAPEAGPLPVGAGAGCCSVAGDPAPRAEAGCGA